MKTFLTAIVAFWLLYINSAISQTSAYLKIQTPQYFDHLISEKSYKLSWTDMYADTINFLWSKDGGLSWDTILTRVESTSKYPWVIPNSIQFNAPTVKGTFYNCLFKIENMSHTIFDNVLGITVSDTDSISNAPLTLRFDLKNYRNYLISGETFSFTWRAYNSGKINVYWSKDGGSSWAILRADINSPNTNFNLDTSSFIVPALSRSYSDCLLKIANKDNSAFNIIDDCTFSNKAPYQYFEPIKTTKWVAGDDKEINFVNTEINPWKLNYQKIKNDDMNLIYDSYNDSHNLIETYNWSIPLFLDSGFYCLALFDYFYDRYFYSDTFHIALAPPSLSIYTPNAGSIIYSNKKFAVSFQAVNCGKINIEISTDKGATWDTIARNMNTVNDYNSYLPEAQVFTKDDTTGMLKVSGITNAAYSIISNLVFKVNSPYEFVFPTFQTLVKPGDSLQIKVRKNTNDSDEYLYFNYAMAENLLINGFINSASDNDSIITTKWSIPNDLDTGYYSIYINKGGLIMDNFVLYSDNFYIGSIRPVQLNKPSFDLSSFFSVYPNPVSNNLTITFSAGFENVYVAINDIKGRQVYSGKLNTTENTINVSYLSQGVYIIKLSNSKAIQTQKFIKQ